MKVFDQTLINFFYKSPASFKSFKSLSVVSKVLISFSVGYKGFSGP